jgi:DNA-binding NarL/FixJ family response regulator
LENGHHSTRQISILIADDHAIFAEGLRLLLERKYLVVGAVADGRALVDEGIRLRPDVVVTDLSMPLLNGLDAARRIKEAVPKVRFAFLTMHDDPHLAAAALELGHVAFVLKRSGGLELLGAIEHILRGQSYLSPKLKPIDCVAAKAMVSQLSKTLTKRQRDVVQLFAEGRPAKEIASILDLSEKTIQFHKYHIMQAFNIKNNAELVLFALERGLISVNSEPQDGMRAIWQQMHR